MVIDSLGAYFVAMKDHRKIIKYEINKILNMKFNNRCITLWIPTPD